MFVVVVIDQDYESIESVETFGPFVTEQEANEYSDMFVEDHGQRTVLIKSVGVPSFDVKFAPVYSALKREFRLKNWRIENDVLHVELILVARRNGHIAFDEVWVPVETLEQTQQKMRELVADAAVKVETEKQAERQRKADATIPSMVRFWTKKRQRR